MGIKTDKEIMKEIDLASKKENGLMGDDMAPKPYYPKIYLDNIEELEGCKVGEEITLKGVITETTERENEKGEDYSVVVEVKSAVKWKIKKEKKEAGYKNDDAEIEKGLAEAEAEAEEKEESEEEEEK